MRFRKNFAFFLLVEVEDHLLVLDDNCIIIFREVFLGLELWMGDDGIKIYLDE